MEDDSLLCHVFSLIDVLAGCYTTWKVWKRNTKIAIGIFVNDC